MFGCCGGMCVEGLHVEMGKRASDYIVCAWNVLCRNNGVVYGGGVKQVA